MADITPIASLNGKISPIASLTGELSMPEKVWMQGPPGAAATVTVGTVTTGEPGTDAIVTNSGTESAAVFNFTIPRGGTGPAGAGVPDGGTAGQLLGKTGSGTAWIDPPQGSVTDGSITLAKLAAEVTAMALGGAAASHTHGAGDINSGVLDVARIPVLDGTKLGTGSVGTAQLGAAAVTAEKIAALAVLAQHIANGAVTTQKLAAGAVTAEKIADGAITPASIGALPLAGGTMTGKMQNTYELDSGVEITHANEDADCGISINKASSNKGGAMFIGVGISGKVGIYDRTLKKWIFHTEGTNIFIDDLLYRHIYVGTSATPPSDWRPGDIYLQYQ